VRGAPSRGVALMIPQRDTECLLIQHLQTLEVERQVESVVTPWLIGCDGAHSAVRHGLNVEFHGSAQGDEWLIADVRLAGESARSPVRLNATAPT
jgi:2-polyprenyl-6-methoxyphenol hydroxylase-like FAD-dependent oxidoreductase